MPVRHPNNSHPRGVALVKLPIPFPSCTLQVKEVTGRMVFPQKMLNQPRALISYYITVDRVAQEAVSLGKGALIAKIDNIKSAGTS